MRLKQIHGSVVVHPSTSDEAKQLLAILHENGYEWYHKYAPIPNPNLWQVQYIYIYQSLHGCKNVITHCDRRPFEKFFTLVEFKERYCEEEKPQPKFEKGQWVRITNKKHPHYGHKGKVGEVFSYDPKYDRYRINGMPSEWEPGDLEPYTEPETKPTENMEIKEKELGEKGNNPQNFQLDLCELLEGRCTAFYSPMWGDTDVLQVYDANLRIAPCKNHATWLNTDEQGKCDDDGICMLWPSRAFYEQYPLDPNIAWMKWKEEQKKIALDVNFRTYDAPDFGEILYFRTPADRDKCIEEIQTIIEKYSKK